MTGSHEVRGSIPLGSTNICNTVKGIHRGAFYHLCAYSANFKICSELGPHTQAVAIH